MKKIVALMMLWLMLLSITPKSFLHEMLADHTDITSCNDENVSGPCIHKKGFNCQQSDVVVPSFYNCAEELVTGLYFNYFSDTKENYISYILQNLISCRDSRGPPVHI